MKPLTAKEKQAINQRIAEFMGVPLTEWVDPEGDCHERYRPIKERLPYERPVDPPDYCSPESPRQLLEEVEKEIKRLKNYKIFKDNFFNIRTLLFGHSDEERTWYWNYEIITASAEVRATAIFQALGGKLDE